jgi:hypothetical protein
MNQRLFKIKMHENGFDSQRDVILAYNHTFKENHLSEQSLSNYFHNNKRNMSLQTAKNLSTLLTLSTEDVYNIFFADICEKNSQNIIKM